MKQNVNIVEILKMKLQIKYFENFVDFQERLILLELVFDVF